MSEDALRVGIVYDDTIDRFGGIGLYVVTLGAALMQRGHHVEYLLGNSTATRVGGAAVHSLARNIEVRFNGNTLSMPAWSNGRQLTHVLESGAFDVLHVQVPYSPLMAGRLLTRVDSRCAVIGTYHVASDRLLPRGGACVLRALKFRSASRFDETVSVSRVAAEFSARWSRIDAERVVPNMLDIDEVRSMSEQAPNDIDADIVFVGRLVPRKGVEELITAVALLNERLRTPAKVAVIGDGPLRAKLERLTRRLALGHAVTFHGAIADEAKLSALSRAPVACFPSLFGESFGVVILEALAAGCGVVVAGDNPGYAELLDDSRAIVDPSDPTAFASRLQAFLEDDALRMSVGSAQRELLRRYDADHVVEEVLGVYRDALEARRGDRVTARPQGVSVVAT